MRERKPPPMTINTIVIVAWRRIALTGVRLDLFTCANIAGRYPSRPATQMRRAEVNVDPAGGEYEYPGNDVRDNSPFSAPKQEMATMTAKTTPPAGPKSVRPKSRATVLLRPTVTLSNTTKYDTFASKKRI